MVSGQDENICPPSDTRKPQFAHPPFQPKDAHDHT